MFWRRALAVAFPSLTGSLITGTLWTYLGWGSYWSWRPAGVWLLVLWLVLTVTLHIRVAPRWQGGVTALLTLVGFLVALLSLPLLGYGLAAT